MSQKPTRDDYLNECRRIEQEFFQQKYLMKYVKKGKLHPRKVGVVLAYKDKSTDKVKIGWSLCCNKDKFLREVAIATALKSDHQLELGSDQQHIVPATVGEYITNMVEKATKYFLKNDDGKNSI